MHHAGRVVAATGATLFACLAYVYLTLPDVRPLAANPPETTAFIELRAREAVARNTAPRREQRWVDYDEISPHLTRAVVVAEDGRFWQHDGVDVEEIRESIRTGWERRAFPRGASTITQQLAKNLYLSPTRSPLRKLRELFIARRLEAELSKRRILEIYLNVIEWGDGVYGAEAAAREYFGAPAASLGPDEATLLAAAIPSPRVLDPAHPSRRLLGRQRILRDRMRDADDSKAEPQAPVSGPRPPSSEPRVPSPASR